MVISVEKNNKDGKEFTICEKVQLSMFRLKKKKTKERRGGSFLILKGLSQGRLFWYLRVGQEPGGGSFTEQY